MKLILYILTFLYFSFAFCQTRLYGIYKNDKNYINLSSDSTVEFETEYGCCLTSVIYGCGTYKLINDKIVINTTNTLGKLKTKISSTKNLNDSTTICITLIEDNDNIASFVVPVIRRYKNDKFVTELRPNEIQKIDTQLQLNPSLYYIDINSLGIDRLKIPLNDLLGKSVVIKLSNIISIENQTVEFDIIKSNGNTALLGPYIGKDRINQKRKKAHTAILKTFTK